MLNGKNIGQEVDITVSPERYCRDLEQRQCRRIRKRRETIGSFIREKISRDCPNVVL